jgi:hypothetical protein
MVKKREKVFLIGRRSLSLYIGELKNQFIAIERLPVHLPIVTFGIISHCFSPERLANLIFLRWIGEQLPVSSKHAKDRRCRVFSNAYTSKRLHQKEIMYKEIRAL